MSERLRIATCNHQDGGGAPGAWTRLEEQLARLAALRLDVLFSTEGKHWLEKEEQGLNRAMHALGMIPHVARADRHGCHVVIWTRPERIHVRATHHQERHPFWHAQCVVEVDIEGFTTEHDEPVWLIGSHLAPFHPEIRNTEARALTEFYSRLAILGGDYNDEGAGNHPGDEDPPTSWARLPKAKQLRHEHYDGTTAAEIMRDSGYVDIGAAVHPKPADRERTAGFKDGAAIRCDRLLVSTRMAERCASMTYDVLPYDERLSDHRIVMAVLGLT